LYSRNH
jgi:hypothetical protein